MNKLFAVLLFVLSCLHCSAQSIEGAESADMKNYAYRVKQIDEFMQRFNGKISVIDKSDKEWRRKNLTMLFDRDLYKKRQQEVDELVREIIQDSITINFTDSSWVASATCNASIGGKTTTIILSLKTERVKDNIYKWVICNAEGDVLKNKPTKQGNRISPVENELNFMSLSGITSTQNTNITNYADKCFKIDQLSVFYTLVYHKLLKINYVSQLKYRFSKMPNREFTVKHIERKGINSGWLICDFK